MKTFTQFLEQRDTELYEQMDMPPASPPAMVRQADNQLDKQKEDKQKEEKYLASIKKEVEATNAKPEVYDVINYLSASSTSFEDLKKLGDRIYDLSALNKIKLKFYGYDGGVSFEWFDKNKGEKGEIVKTRTMNTFDTFQRFKILLDDLFPLVGPIENDKSSNKKIEIPDIKKYLPNRSN